MNKLILCAAAGLAALVAVPASAQTINVGAGIGNINGSVANAGSSNLGVTHNESLDVNIDRTLTGSSGSGFGGDLVLSGNNASANFRGEGLAGTYINSTSPGQVFSVSGNIGDFTASTNGNASVDGQVMNFGQSEFTNSFTLDYSHADAFAYSEAQTTAGAFNVNGFGVWGSLGWED